MLRIHCPLCGERPYTEFRYGGDAGKRRPAHGAAGFEAWHDYLFLFDNPMGPHREFWQHVHGCRQWLVAERDTSTNAVGKVTLARARQVGDAQGQDSR